MDSESVDYTYALKCIFNAHAADVRVVTSTTIPHDGILTGSRDNTAKVWAPEGKSYKECNVFTGASTFISSLCVLPASSQYPAGLLLAGSNDCSIYGFTPDSPEPVLRLLGHSGPVCSLSYGKYGYLLSGSWDKTARVWSGQHCISTLQGHTESVWATAVFPTQDGMLTGSADRTIRLWRGGVCEKTFSGHEDCVRGLAILSDTEFLSCSNDCSVRSWVITGDCVGVYTSHTDYIYSITLLNNGTDFATCGEDQNIKIWRNGVCAQTVVIAPKSLWSVTCLSNGDLAVGTSDGKVYVLEKVPVDHFEKLSEQNNVLSEGRSTFIKENDKFMMSEGSNIRSSIYNGETIVFYEYQSNYMYVCQYNHENGTTVKKEELNFKFIEDTFFKKPNESTDENAGFSPEVTNFLSCSRVDKPYDQFKKDMKPKKDYVFDVDVENTIYKLSFNKGENPWEVAMKFVAEHNLPNDHVGQIVDFLLENAASAFANEFYPVSNYITYLKINILGLKTKLLEFSEKVDKESYVSPSEIDKLILLASITDRVSVDQLSSLEKAISWNDEFLFPVLDLLRIGVRCKGIFAKVPPNQFVNRLLCMLGNTSKTVNIILIEKIFCNMFVAPDVGDALLCNQAKIFDSVKEKIVSCDKSIQKAGSALFLNFAIASSKNFEIDTDSFCANVIDIIKCISDSDAIYRILVAIGTACSCNPLAMACFKSRNIKNDIRLFENCYDNPNIKKVVELLCLDF